jgi:hypothetical protein
MTQEEKQLLFKDLCARLPYGVKYCRESWNYEWGQEMSVVEVMEDIDKDGYINYYKVYKVWDIKPYLRPMSSMTEKEKKEHDFYCGYKPYDENIGESYLTEYDMPDYIDFLYEHHLDYRGLIEKGLALKAPEGMYKEN